MGQNLHENVPSISNNAGTKSQQKLCQFFLNIKNNKGLTKYELSKEFDLSEVAIKKRLFLHRKKLPCISLESESNLYRHDKNKCRLVGQKQRELVKQTVPPKVAISLGRKDQLISSDNYIIAWLSDKFHVSESIIDDLFEFTWRDQIIEIHGAMYETQTDYRPYQKEEYELPQLTCNKYCKVYVQIYPSGKLTAHMGPAVINDIIEVPLDFEMASENEMWLEESRRQFDQVLNYNKELDDKTKWLFTAFMSIITVIATIWGIAGLPENKWIPGILLILSVIGLIFFWRIAKTTNLEILNIHGELLQIDKDDQKTDSKYQYKRLIIGFEYIIRQLKAYNETKAN